MNILESIMKTADQPTTLPHLGEAYGLWCYYVLCSTSLSLCQLAQNHAHDEVLRRQILDLSHDLEEPQLRKLRAVMANEGVPFPLEMPRHPKADPSAIPPGARMDDIEIAGILALKLESLITTGTLNMQQSIREDLGAMYIAFNADLVRHSLKFKKLMQEHGWLIVPPLYGPASVSH